MNTILTTELIDRCHAGSRAKGFWEEVPPKGQQLMLVVSELAEAIEAHRKGRKTDWNKYNERLKEAGHPREASMQMMLFEGFIKDSVEDELADAYIRLCDFAGGFQEADALLAFYKWGDYSYTLNPNFGGALFQLVGHICDGLQGFESVRPDQLAEAMKGIEALCAREGIDLAKHIDMKLAFNKTRAAKHGKSY